jgi:hypothetical protein
VHHGDAPYIGGWAGTSSYALCDAAGNVVWLDAASGATLHRERLAESVRSCMIQSEAPPKRAETRIQSLAAQLRTALSIDDALSSPLQVELLDDLDQLDDANDATTALIALAREDDEHAETRSTNVRQHAAELLARRTRGLDAMLHALHHDDDLTLPLAAIASALRRNLHTAAAPLLAARLNELGWSARAISAVADALEALAGTAERRALVVFVARAGCDPLHGDAALTVARTLGRLGGAASVRKVADSCEDGEIAAKLRAAVAASLYGPPR